MLISQINIYNNSKNKYRQNFHNTFNKNVGVAFGYKQFLQNSGLDNIIDTDEKKNKTVRQVARYTNGFHIEPQLVKLPSYVAPDVKEYEVEMVNHSRKKILNSWFSELEKIATGVTKSKLTDTFEENPDLRLFILSSLTTFLQSSNRLIPPPFDNKALETTISNCFENKETNKVSPSLFISEYNNTLVEQTIDSLIKNPMYQNAILYSKDGKTIDRSSIGSSKDLSSLWVKVPSVKQEYSSPQYVSVVENLSNPNWCTRTRQNKAVSVLLDGPFYIFLERNMNGRWDSKAAITTFNGKISQIQGKKNDNFIPMQMRNMISHFLTEIGAISTTENYSIKKNYRCAAGYDSELPYAYTQLLIAQKLAEVTKKPDGVRQTSLNTALKNKDSLSIFKLLYPSSEPQVLESGKLSIKSYKPAVHIDYKSSVVPVSLMGVNEDELLADVERVETVIDLCDSSIKSFPKSLKSVDGKLILSVEQYEKFKDFINEKYDFTSISKMSKKMKDMVVISNMQIKE